MTDLIEKLNAVLDEYERIARAATPGPWETSGKGAIDEWTVYGDGWAIARTEHFPRTDMVNHFPKLRKPATVVEHGNENAEHIVTQDPKHILAVIAAHRMVVDQYVQTAAIKEYIGDKKRGGVELTAQEWRDWVACDDALAVLMPVLEAVAKAYEIEVKP